MVLVMLVSSVAYADYAGELVTGLTDAKPVVVGNTIYWAAVSLPDAGKPDAGVDAGTPVVPVPAVIPTTLADGGVLAACKQKQVICFSPEGNCDLQVVALIDRAVSKLDVIIYSFNRVSIVDAVLRAKARGVNVRLIVDASQIGEPREVLQLRRVLAAGVPMKRDTHQGIMHMKVVVRDNQEFLTGSFNFTNNATENNDENLLVWDCQRLALVYVTKFDALWAKFKDATDSVLKGTDGGVDGG
jgi:phosphatidylserine/phosphatidylglycerophosphate/cardiolipin synthase-like enzyme